jgi:hypothetical protein
MQLDFKTGQEKFWAGVYGNDYGEMLDRFQSLRVVPMGLYG